MNTLHIASPLAAPGLSIPSNIEMTCVTSAFDALCVEGRREYYECTRAPVCGTAMLFSHFKGVAGFGGKLIFTHTDVDLFSAPSHGKYLVGSAIGASGQGEISSIGDTAHPGWPHPCGTQACGSFMAMGIQKSAISPGSDTSDIQIYDISAVPDGGPIRLLTAIHRLHEGINGVGMTREAGIKGRYVVAGVNGTSLTVYRSATSALVPGEQAGFTCVFEQSDFPDSGAGLALVTQKYGGLYLISMNANDDGSDSQIALYKLDLDAAPATCTQVAVKKMPIPGTSDSITLLVQYLAKHDWPFGPVVSGVLSLLGGTMNSSFRWGKGLVVTSPDTLTIFATDRNVLPLSQIPELGSRKDFSVVVWDKNIVR